MLLENNQIRPGIRSGIVRERVVWQAESAHQIRTAHHLHSDKWTGSIHHPLRGNESHYTTFMHGVEGLQEEVIVYSLC